jgi:hypothetical protein
MSTEEESYSCLNTHPKFIGSIELGESSNWIRLAYNQTTFEGSVESVLYFQIKRAQWQFKKGSAVIFDKIIFMNPTL